MKRSERDLTERGFRDYDDGRITTDLRPGRWRSRGYRGKGPKNYKRSDEWIREDAALALTESRWVDASDIEVSVIDGVVILTGSVLNRRMKKAAEDCVERVHGVADVRNELILTNLVGNRH